MIDDDEGDIDGPLDATILTANRPAASPQPESARRYLLVFSGTSSWLHQLPASGRVIIGRADTADLRIDDSSISRQHAAIEIAGETVTIRDLGSQNGTFVNDVKLRAPQTLRVKDVVTIHTTTLILHVAATVSPAAALVLDFSAFRRRLEDEIDRAVRYERTFSLLCLTWPTAAIKPQQPRLQQAVADQLRRIDAASWVGSVLYVLLAEATGDEGIAIARRVRDSLDPKPQIGHATCPADGYDVEALLASADNAAHSARPGVVGGTSRAFETLTIGDQRVIVADPVMARLYALIERLAVADLPVMVTGETGCGKELAATALHVMSRRRAQRLITLNCAAIAETLVESELFGHEKGAFTGAVTAKPGLIEAASGSTLFLDEVGELTLATQAKLLRVLENRRVTRIGDHRERDIDVRIVCATNRDIDAEIVNGKFRQDLYFRLSAATLLLPPLRERPRELPLLATSFLGEACRRANRPAMIISNAAMALLLAHSWPGNIRELKNLMQYLVAAHHVDVLEAEHIQERLASKPRTPSISLGGDPVSVDIADASESSQPVFRPIAEELREFETRRMKEALEATGGNQTRAAKLMSMPVRTFFEKVKQYGLTPKKKSAETG